MIFPSRAAGSYEFLIQSNSLPGTPLVPRKKKGEKGAEEAAEVPTHIALNVSLFDAAEAELAAEQITVSTAPVIFIDNTQPAERLYMCQIPEKDRIDRGNLPSVTEVKEIMRKIRGVGFVLIPEEVNNRDAWIQDQFQTGYCQSPSGIMRVIIHLPRLRSNVVQSEFQSNLATFVPEHFPSTNLGLFQDFYERQVGTGRDKQGKVRKITFLKSYELSLLLKRVQDVWDLIRALYPLHLSKSSQDAELDSLLIELPFMSFFKARLRLKKAAGLMRKLLIRRQRHPGLKDGQMERLIRRAGKSGQTACFGGKDSQV